MLARPRTCRAVPCDVLGRLLRHHVAEERRGKATVRRRTAGKGVERLVVLLPSVDGEVDGGVHLWLPEDTVEQLQLEDVRVGDALRLVLVGAAAEEYEALLKEDLEIAAPRANLQHVPEGLEQRREAVAGIKHNLRGEAQIVKCTNVSCAHTWGKYAQMNLRTHAEV